MFYHQILAHIHHPVNLECKLVKIVELAGNNDLFIGEIVNTYINEECFSDNVADIKKIDGEKFINDNIKGKFMLIPNIYPFFYAL